MYSGSVTNFALYIAEDDGTADADFPCLESKEIVSKFGFTSLALVRTSDSNSGTEPSSAGDTEVKKTTSSEQPPAAVLESTDYHSFSGFLLHKVRPKTEISLGKRFILVSSRIISKIHFSSMFMVSFIYPI